MEVLCPLGLVRGEQEEGVLALNGEGVGLEAQDGPGDFQVPSNSESPQHRV